MTWTHDLPHEPQFPKSPEAAAGTSPSAGGGPPAHFGTLARILSVTPELVPQALARLIASEREAARAEALGEAATAIRESACTEAGWPDVGCIVPKRVGGLLAAAAIVRDLANTT